MTTLATVPKIEQTLQTEPLLPSRDLRRWALIMLVTVTAILIHGYHPYSEDAAIYVPAIKKLLNPNLYPHGAQFFLAPAHLSLFSNIVAASVRLTQLPLSSALLLWHIASLTALFAGCWRLCYLCFEEKSASWSGTLLIAAFLTVPIAGSSLMLADPYLTSRSMSTPALVFACCYLLEDKFFKAFLLMLCAFLVHPLMAAYGGVFLLTLYGVRRRQWWVLLSLACCISCVTLVAIQHAKHSSLSVSYQTAVLTRSYCFLSQWAWYEIAGIVAPLCLFAWMIWREKLLLQFRLGACALAAFLNGGFFLLLALAVTRTPDQLWVARYQPMRTFHLLYILMFLLPVNLLAQKILEKKVAIFALLLAITSCAMFAAQRNAFPASSHLELPGTQSDNPWQLAFQWVRLNTPKDALFALAPDYPNEPAEDRSGFSAVAERSALANRTKDGGVVAVFPELAEEWEKEVGESTGTEKIRSDQDALPLEQAGVTWIVTRAASDNVLDCPYRNTLVAVCHVPQLSAQLHRR